MTLAEHKILCLLYKIIPLKSQSQKYGYTPCFSKDACFFFKNSLYLFDLLKKKEILQLKLKLPFSKQF